MAVAPINKVRQVVEYAVTQIPRNKLDLGIPNYGYDWPLPYVQGETAATTIGNIEAIEIAAANGAQIFFDDQSIHTLSAAQAVPAARVPYCSKKARRRQETGFVGHAL